MGQLCCALEGALYCSVLSVHLQFMCARCISTPFAVALPKVPCLLFVFQLFAIKQLKLNVYMLSFAAHV